APIGEDSSVHLIAGGDRYRRRAHRGRRRPRPEHRNLCSYRPCARSLRTVEDRSEPGRDTKRRRLTSSGLDEKERNVVYRVGSSCWPCRTGGGGPLYCETACLEVWRRGGGVLGEYHHHHQRREQCPGDPPHGGAQVAESGTHESCHCVSSFVA